VLITCTFIIEITCTFLLTRLKLLLHARSNAWKIHLVILVSTTKMNIWNMQITYCKNRTERTLKFMCTLPWHHYMSNYYTETKACVLQQPLVRTCIVVVDMNPTTIKPNNLDCNNPLPPRTNHQHNKRKKQLKCWTQVSKVGPNLLYCNT
jgi:hypothetical protein